MGGVCMSSTETSSDQRRPLEAKSRRGQKSQIVQTGQMDQRTQQEDQKLSATKKMEKGENGEQVQTQKSEDRETTQRIKSTEKAAMRTARISSPVSRTKNLCQFLQIATRHRGCLGPVSTAHMSTILA